MGNRIYIAAGILVIVLLLAAFIAPRFWPWDSYRPNLEAMASEALGVEVEIAGSLDFTLLPQPRLVVEEIVLSGPAGRLGRAEAVEAEFSLTDFLRDRFTVTRLRVIEPVLNLAINAEGQLELPVDLAQTASARNVSIANAELVDGRIQLYDQRSEQAVVAEGLSGTMQVDALRGPFSFAGQVTLEGTSFTADLATTALNPDGEMRLAASLRPFASGAGARRATYAVDGLLSTGARPSFAGSFSYRQPPQAVLGAENSNDTTRGDLVFRGNVEGDLERVVVSEFTFLPDENQVATRLTGAGEITLGRAPRFSARVNGGVVTLIPPDLSLNQATGPYELVRLLESLPAPVIPPIPGDLSLSVSELGLRSLRLRDVRVSAAAEDGAWEIFEASAALPGNTTASLTGRLGQVPGWPVLSGRLVMESQALDGLSALWMRRREGNPLFGQSGRLETDIRLAVELLELRNGRLTLGEVEHGFALTARLGEQRSLSLRTDLGEMNGAQSAVLAGLFPVAEGQEAFLATFPQGQFALTAAGARVAGLGLEAATLSGGWRGPVVTFEEAVLQNFGGLDLDGAGSLRGSEEGPQLSFEGTVAVDEDAPVMGLLAAADPALAQMVARHLPAALEVALSAPGRDGAQRARIEGQAGALDIVLDADLDRGAAGVTAAPLSFTLSASTEEDAAPLFTQFGMRPLFTGSDGALLSLSGRGSLRRSLDVDVDVEGGGERVDFTGTLFFNDGSSLRGQGHLAFILEDTGPLMALAGAPGIWLPPVEGEAELGFIGGENVTLSGLTGLADGVSVTGDLTYAAQPGGATLSGEVMLDALALETLVAMAAGPEALAERGEVWPQGAVSVGAAGRTTRGRVRLAAAEITAGGAPLLADAGLEFGWDPQEVRVRALTGQVAGGTLSFEAALCCSSDLAARSLSGLASLEGADLTQVLPGGALSGRFTTSARFQGNGDSLAELIGSLVGEGSFSVDGLEIAGLSTDAFTAAAENAELVEAAPETFAAEVGQALEAGPFRAGNVAGVASIAGGNVRISNFAVDGQRARLLGGLTLDLETLQLGGDWTFATTVPVDDEGLITETTGRIGLALSGPLWAPERALDVTRMADAIQMRALELELEELERLRAQDEARRAANAAEQARLSEEAARRRAQELLDAQSEEVRQQIEAELAGQEAVGTEEEVPAEAPDEESPPQGVLGPLQLDPFALPAPL